MNPCQKVNAGALLAAALTSVIWAPIASGAEPEVAPADVVHSMENSFGVHTGERRNHIKGTCAVGEFIGSKEAASYSNSALFSGAPVPVVARFSLAGGNPQIADTALNSRGLGIEFRLPGGIRQHMTMLNTPVFIAAQPATFNELIVASKPDPATGKPDSQKLQAFFASHPETMASTSFMKQHNPPANYFSSAFYSIHAFKFIDANKVEHLIKWRFVPQAGEKALTDAELKTAPHDFLEQNLITGAKSAPLKWDMMVVLGQPGDPETNPTVPWPENRQQFKAGTLSITSAMPQKGAECEKINFDPLVMADGIAPTNDPILLFRSPAYAISFGKRISGQ